MRYIKIDFSVLYFSLAVVPRTWVDSLEKYPKNHPSRKKNLLLYIRGLRCQVLYSLKLKTMNDKLMYIPNDDKQNYYLNYPK